MTTAIDAPSPVPDIARPATASDVARSASALALYGGARAVTEPYRERWRRIRLRDILRLAREAWRQNNTAIMGGWIGEFERRFAALTDTQHALLMNSGTATLHSAYFAAGVGPGDEVIVPAYTFFASASPILQCGGVPVFCDIDASTLTADPDDVERRITPRTKAICVVHVWGNPARLDRFVDIARRRNVILIEDCSHAHGATYQGRPVGSWGDIGCFSLQGQKPVSGGELGIAVTSNAELFDRMLILGHFGRIGAHQQTGKYDVGELSLGLKFRPHLYGAIVACGSLDRLDELNRRRRANYARISRALVDVPAVRPIETYPDAERGGLLEYLFRYDPAHAGGWTVGAFAAAVAAEGAPIYVDRYTVQDGAGRLLHQSRLFSQFDLSRLGGVFAAMPPRDRSVAPVDPPVNAEALADRLLAMPPLTDVSDAFIDQCAAAIRKVAGVASQATDLRQ